MFIGHYAPVLALRAARKSPPLAAGFIAVQLIDVGFFTLSYFGIEKWRPNPSLTGFMPVDLYYMPFTHSLAGSAAWGIAAGLVMAMFAPAGRKLLDGLFIALLVVSHWFLDLIVHRHDLPLVHDAEEKLGFGLWNEPALVAPLELGLFFAGFALFMNATRPRGMMGRVVPWFVLAVLLAIQGVNWFTPPAADAASFSGLGLLVYFAFALLALWMDRVRAERNEI